MKKGNSVEHMTWVGVIAGLYAALTVGLAPVSFGLVQCRVAEALTVLAAFTPAAVPGLTIGCFLANLVGLSMGANVAGALDLLLGPLATGLAAGISYVWRHHRVKGLPLLSTLPPVALNALIVGGELALVAPQFSAQVLATQVALVGVGQLVACVGGGLLVAKGLQATGLAERLFKEKK